MQTKTNLNIASALFKKKLKHENIINKSGLLAKVQPFSGYAAEFAGGITSLELTLFPVNFFFTLYSLKHTN